MIADEEQRGARRQVFPAFDLQLDAETEQQAEEATDQGTEESVHGGRMKPQIARKSQIRAKSSSASFRNRVFPKKLGFSERTTRAIWRRVPALSLIHISEPTRPY